MTIILKSKTTEEEIEVFDDIMLSALKQGRFIVNIEGRLSSLNQLVNDFKFPVNCEIVKYLDAHKMFDDKLETYVNLPVGQTGSIYMRKPDELKHDPKEGEEEATEATAPAAEAPAETPATEAVAAE